MAFSFGAGGAFGAGPSSAPAAAATGFSFGSNPPASAAKPVASLSTGLSFGTAGTTAFGATTSTAAPAFGAVSAAPAFGAVSAAPAFGAASTAPTTSLFGATSTAPAFGAPSTAAPAFGATSAAPAFGAVSAAPAFGAASTAPAFGAVSAAPVFGVASTAPTTSLFGATSTGVAGAPAFGAPVAATATAPSLFGGAAATTAAKPAFGAATSTASVGLGGQNSLGTTAPFGVPSSTFHSISGNAPSAVGGNVGNATVSAVAIAGNAGGAIGQAKKDDSWKDSQVPPEFNQDVENFRKFVKEQKSVSTDMSHLSLPKLHQKIKSDVEGLSAVVQQLSSGVAKQKAQLERLKKDCAKELANVEVAQRTKDTPPALQYENNNGPLDYFNRLLTNFESQMVVYKRQIEDVEKYLQTANGGGGGGGQSGVGSTPETLIKAMQKTHSAFISLAGRYQPLHEAIQQQKSIYVQQYRQKHGTTENPFSVEASKLAKKELSKSNRPGSVGPSPFTGKPDPVSLARAAALANQSTTNNQTVGVGGPPTFGAMSSGNPGLSFGFPGGANTGTTMTSGGIGGFGSQQPANTGNTSLFSSPKPAFGSVPAPATALGGSLFGNQAQQQPGILGSMLQTPAAGNTSLFGQQTPQNQLTFGGKRGKH